MRTTNFFLAVVFLVFAFLQVNEPDAFTWILMYGAMTVVCIMAMFEMYYKSVLLLLGGVFLVYGFILFQRVGLDEFREFLKPGICLLVLFFQFFQSLRIK